MGLIGCGNIAAAYVKGCRAFDLLDVVACADLDPARATALAAEYAIPRALSVEALLADPAIDLVLNLTVPAVHAEVSLAVLAAGKHVHSEKPLALTRADGRAILDAAERAGLRVGCAPDTFLGGGLQTCRKLIDDGAIGTPVAATAFMMGRGPEAWHPNPFFFYQPGGGPLLDMGPYYFTALVHLLGPVARVSAAARAALPERIAGHADHAGKPIPVAVNTHVSALLEFARGPIGTVVISFDIFAGSSLPRLEIYGTEGTLIVPDPNTFGGPVRLRRADADDWVDVPLTHSAEVGRGIGLADLADALATGRPHRASGALAYHVLDIMLACEEAAASGQRLTLESQVEPPAPLPADVAAHYFGLAPKLSVRQAGGLPAGEAARLACYLWYN